MHRRGNLPFRRHAARGTHLTICAGTGDCSLKADSSDRGCDLTASGSEATRLWRAAALSRRHRYRCRRVLANMLGVPLQISELHSAFLPFLEEADDAGLDPSFLRASSVDEDDITLCKLTIK